MIRYRLVCKDCDINFESWFSSSKEYEKLKSKKFKNCHICNSLNVEKTLMSPSVFIFMAYSGRYRVKNTKK